MNPAVPPYGVPRTGFQQRGGLLAHPAPTPYIPAQMDSRAHQPPLFQHTPPQPYHQHALQQPKPLQFSQPQQLQQHARPATDSRQAEPKAEEAYQQHDYQNRIPGETEEERFARETKEYQRKLKEYELEKAEWDKRHPQRAPDYPSERGSTDSRRSSTRDRDDYGSSRRSSDRYASRHSPSRGRRRSRSRSRHRSRSPPKQSITLTKVFQPHQHDLVYYHQKDIEADTRVKFKIQPASANGELPVIITAPTSEALGLALVQIETRILQASPADATRRAPSPVRTAAPPATTALDKEEERYQRDLAEYQEKLKRYEKYQEELAEYEKAKALWEQQHQNGPYAPGDVRNKPAAQRAAEDARARRESPPRPQQPPHLQDRRRPGSGAPLLGAPIHDIRRISYPESSYSRPDYRRPQADVPPPPPANHRGGAPPAVPPRRIGF